MKSFAAVLLLAAAASAATVVNPSSYVYSAQSAYPEVQVKGVNSPVSSSYLSRAVVSPQVVAPVAPVAPVYAGQVAYQAQPYAYAAQPYAAQPYVAQPYAYGQYVQPALSAYPGVASYAQPAVYAPTV